MPSDSEHAKLSKARTGKDFLELHQWMNDSKGNHKQGKKRHDITNIPETMGIVREKFGDDGIKEFLYHIKEDYEDGIEYKTINFAKRAILMARTIVFSPFRGKQE